MLNMKNNLIIFIIVSAVLAVFPACEKSAYKTILETDEYGQVLGGDQGDWQPRCAGIVPDYFHCVVPAYPNPAREAMNFIISTQDEAYITINIHHSKYIVIRHFIENQLVGQGNHQFAWDLRDNEGERLKDGYYRVKIKVESLNGYSYESYGDIEID
jgi:hypothetical protein